MQKSSGKATVPGLCGLRSQPFDGIPPRSIRTQSSSMYMGPTPLQRMQSAHCKPWHAYIYIRLETLIIH